MKGEIDKSKVMFTDFTLSILMINRIFRKQNKYGYKKCEQHY